MLGLAAAAMIAGAGNASAALSAGSIAFVGFNSDGDDDLAFVALETITAGTKIFFTDNEPGSDGSLNSGEGVFSFTNTGAIAAGTVVTISDLDSSGGRTSTFGTFGDSSGSFNISTGGDAVYAFIGSVASPTYLAGVTNGNAADETGNITGAGLVDGTTDHLPHPPQQHRRCRVHRHAQR